MGGACRNAMCAPCVSRTPGARTSLIERAAEPRVTFERSNSDAERALCLVFVPHDVARAASCLV